MAPRACPTIRQLITYCLCAFVCRGEILEILDDSRKWWKARNSRGQVAHVPHTIVGEMEHGTSAPSSHHREAPPVGGSDDWIRERQGKKGFRYF